MARGTAAGAWPNNRGFVGGTLDSTGLTHLGARDYDPGAGRFISVDPVQDLTDPQQWNAYSYASGNPVTNSDPSGLCETDACISHQNHLDNRDQPPGSDDGDSRPHPNPTPSANPGPNGGGNSAPSATPSPSPYLGESMEYQEDWNRRYNEMCSQPLLTEICSDAVKRSIAEPVSWIPYAGIPAQAWLVKDDYDNGHPVAAGIGAAGMLPLGKIFAKAAKGLKLTKVEQRAVNEFVGNAYRDHIADFLRQNGRVVVTDGQDRAALTFKIPGKTDRILDMKVMDKHGNLLGYIETKSGNAGQDAEQAAKDAYLMKQGVSITYVYDDMANMLY